LLGGCIGFCGLSKWLLGGQDSELNGLLGVIGVRGFSKLLFRVLPTRQPLIPGKTLKSMGFVGFIVVVACCSKWLSGVQDSEINGFYGCIVYVGVYTSLLGWQDSEIIAFLCFIGVWGLWVFLHGCLVGQTLKSIAFWVVLLFSCVYKWLLAGQDSEINCFVCLIFLVVAHGCLVGKTLKSMVCCCFVFTNGCLMGKTLKSIVVVLVVQMAVWRARL
jgi:hypothetical protein